MITSSKLLVRTAIVMLVMLLAISLLVAIHSQSAEALNYGQWFTVRDYINRYFAGQFEYESGGEAGIIKQKLELMNNLTNDADDVTLLASYLDEGDDMANRPVLIDNLANRTDMIPGTEFRCVWNVDQSCFSDSSIQMLREIVDAHRAAGFSTQIVDYCVSSHTASPTTAGFGIIAQTGGLSSDGAVPNVRELEWSRNGWRNVVPPPLTASNPIAPPEPSPGFSLPPMPTPPPNCESETTDLEVVSCQANWAISSTLGNVGSGSTLISGVDTAQTVDVRPGNILTIDGKGLNLQLPFDRLFTDQITDINPLVATYVISHTQHGGQAAMGLKMLGYTMAAGGYLNIGIARWNSTQGQQQTAIGSALPMQEVIAFPSAGKVDSTPPTVSSVDVENVTHNSADIHRVAAEPATLKVELGTTPGVYTNTVNSTILNSDKSVTITGLDPGVTYYWRATSYDGYANGTVSGAESWFTTVPCAGRPDLELAGAAPFWASYADYIARSLSVTYTIANAGPNTAYSVAITGSSASNGVNIQSVLPAPIGDIEVAGAAPATLVYHVPEGVVAFATTNSATAEDDCQQYTYGPALP